MGFEEIADIVEEYSDLVVDLIQPEMILLYGSYANGTNRENSDIDIAVICNSTGNNFLELSHQLYKLRRNIDSRIEPLLIDKGCNDGGFYEDIVKTGKIIYHNKEKHPPQGTCIRYVSPE